MRIRKLILLVLLCCFVCGCDKSANKPSEKRSDSNHRLSQKTHDDIDYFEGRIFYTIDVETTIEGIDQNTTGTESITYFKNGYYKDTSNANYMSYQLWRYNDTSLYYKHVAEDDTLHYMKTYSIPEHDVDYEVVDDGGEIAGYQCSKLVVTEFDRVRQYYFSKELPIDASLYRHFTAFNRYAVMSIIQSMVLRYIDSAPGYMIDVKAFKVERLKLPSTTFELPDYKVINRER